MSKKHKKVGMTFAITTGIKNYKSMIKKKKKRGKIIILVKAKLKIVEVLISKDLKDYCISIQFFSMNNIWRKYSDIVSIVN